MHLILSFSGDIHADAVAWSVRHSGCECAIINHDQFPIKTLMSVNPRTGWAQVKTTEGRIDTAKILTVWNRRSRMPVLPDGIDIRDIEYAMRLNRMFMDEFLYLEANGQTWVNPRASQLRSSSKILQLNIAERMGISIPNTLISNDRDEINNFLHSNKSSIMKPFIGHSWQAGNKTVSSSTAPAPDILNMSELSVRSCPMIYQEKIEKQYELRVLFFGDFLLPIRLDSQASVTTQLDWRIANPASLNPQLTTLPDTIAVKLKLLRRELGLLHGSFDLAVTPEGKFVFFEVNEQGQTLWVEETNPSIPVLDILGKFLMDPKDDFSWDGNAVVSMREFYSLFPRKKAERHATQLAV